MAKNGSALHSRRDALRHASVASLSAAAAAGALGASAARAQVSAESPPLADVMIGMVLRVYHTGDSVTLEHRDDRVNIELGPDDRIARVSFG